MANGTFPIVKAAVVNVGYVQGGPFDVNSVIDVSAYVDKPIIILSLGRYGNGCVFTIPTFFLAEGTFNAGMIAYGANTTDYVKLTPIADQPGKFTVTHNGLGNPLYAYLTYVD